MKYKKELKPSDVEKSRKSDAKMSTTSDEGLTLKTTEGEASSTTAAATATTVSTVPRFYTCPLDQVFCVLSVTQGRTQANTFMPHLPSLIAF